MTQEKAAAEAQKVETVPAVSGKSFVLPPGTFPRIKLAGEQQNIKIIASVDWEVIVEYPDGYRRHHQATEIGKLIEKIDGQLRLRYNIDSYEILSLPGSFSTGETLVIGRIKYA